MKYRGESLRERRNGARRTVLLGALILSAVAAGCSDTDRIVDPAGQDTLTVAFQDLVSPSTLYVGTSDAILKDGPATQFRNGNFGVVPCDTIGAVRLGSALYARCLILKMNISSIKNCSKVIRATLTIYIVPAIPNSLLFGAFRVLPATTDAWVEGIGGLGAGVSWMTVDGGVPWTAEGGDCDDEPLDQELAGDDSTCTFTLPPQVVLDWIKDPQSNHGVVIRKIGPATVETGAWTTVFMREYASARLHPRLEIMYFSGG
jgi:hypothetical protein